MSSTPCPPQNNGNESRSVHRADQMFRPSVVKHGQIESTPIEKCFVQCLIAHIDRAIPLL